MLRIDKFSGLSRTVLAAISVVVALVAAGPEAAQAQQATTTSASQTIYVELNEGQLVRLAKPATSVFIANPAIADVSVKSDRLVYIFGTASGETTMFAVDESDNVVANVKVLVTHNLSRLNEAISQLIPGSNIAATSLDGGIVLSGAVNNATQSENVRRLAARFISEGEDIINQLSVVAPNQVNLRVRIAEVARDVVNEFGFNWESAFIGAQDFLFGVATGGAVVPSSLFGNQTVSPNTAPFANSNPNGVGAGNFLTRPNGLEANSLFFRSTYGNFDVNGLIDLLAQNGLVTILAEPNLTALTGETASFLAGGEFPVPIAQRSDQISVEFRQFGVSLAFTPTMINDNRISMRVRPEVSQLSNNGAVVLNNVQIPALTTRRAETTVELGSGQSFAIAGLLLDNSLQSIDEVPGLSDLPILGALFRSDRFERNETELVIIVTPYVVRPAPSPDVFALPTDPYTNRQRSTAEREMALTPSQPQTLPLGNTGMAGAPIGASGFVLE